MKKVLLVLVAMFVAGSVYAELPTNKGKGVKEQQQKVKVREATKEQLAKYLDDVAPPSDGSDVVSKVWCGRRCSCKLSGGTYSTDSGCSVPYDKKPGWQTR